MGKISEIEQEWIERLAARLQDPLPGREVQYQMAGPRRMQELHHYQPPPDARVACVLNLLHWRDGAWRTLLIQRTANPRDRHSAQISFPGGRYEPEDGELINTALRETFEEVGVPPETVRPLGALTDLYIPVSNFIVHPFVGLLTAEVDFQPHPGEVDAILTPSLEQFTRPESRGIKDVRLMDGVILKDVPYFDVDGQVVWGATAMIIREFTSLIL